jgi:hypothetical protein
MHHNELAHPLAPTRAAPARGVGVTGWLGMKRTLGHSCSGTWLRPVPICTFTTRSTGVQSLDMATVTDTLRRVVERCGQTRYAISKATGIPQAVLSRFVANGRGLRSENIDRLCSHLGLVLTTKQGKSRKGR